MQHPVMWKYLKLTVQFISLAICIGHAAASSDRFYKEKIELSCGTHTAVIECGKARSNDFQDGRVCVRNTLKFISPSGSELIPPTPKNLHKGEHYDRTPISIACMQGEDDKAYVLVNFSAEQFLCGSCMGYDLFTENGTRLTINSKGLDSLIKKLRIKSGTKVYIEKTPQ